MKVYKISEVEKMTGIRAATIAQAINKGKIAAYKEGNYWYVSEMQIKRFDKIFKKVNKKEGKPCLNCGKPSGFTSTAVIKTFCSQECSDIYYQEKGRRLGKPKK